MIKIINKNLISIELVDKQDLENFTKIFTVLDKHKAARTLFAEEVRIEYKQHNKVEIVELQKDAGFTYNDIENILHHLSKHGIELTISVIAATLIAASSNALESKNIAFSFFEGSPQFNIKVSKNIFIITPMSEEHLALNSKNSKRFIELLKNEKNMYDYTIKENTINVVVYSQIHQAIHSIVEALIKSHLLARDKEQEFKEKLRQLAFKDQAFVEYFSIKTINRYPHNHPLRKYESITQDIENILYDFIENEDSKYAVEQLNRLNLEISPDTPRVITKTIDKLVKFH